jgi:putative hydrolase of the HAD superfamily
VIRFDLDGTLLEFTADYGTVLADAIRAVEGEVHDGWLAAYDDTFFELLEACAPDPYRRAFATFGDDPEAMVAALQRPELDATAPTPGVHETLDRLGRDYRIGVITNGTRAWQRRKSQAHDLDTRVVELVTAYDAGAHKPDPAPFRLAETRLEAAAYAMVGDDDDVDVEGARRAGWVPYRYEGVGSRTCRTPSTGLPSRSHGASTPKKSERLRVSVSSRSR